MQDLDWRATLDAAEADVSKIHCAVLVHGRHLEKFDALSLSCIDIDPSGTITGEIPRLEGLRRLFGELTETLNRWYIRQQGHLLHIKSQALLCGKVCDHLRLPSKLDLEESTANLLDVDNFSTAISLQSDAVSMEIHELRASLRNQYVALTAFSETKLALLRCIQDIIECCETALVGMAEANGVLTPAVKYQVATAEMVDALLNHKMFDTSEEHVTLRSIRLLWGRLSLNGNPSQELSEKDLARAARLSHFSSKTKYLALKFGAALVLLLWTVSECFNNERSSYRVWNDPTFAIFMCIGDFLLLQFMWGLSMYVWRRAGIDFVHLLQLQHTEVGKAKFPAAMVIESATHHSLVFLCVFIAFNKLVHFALRGGHSLAVAHALPVLLAIYCLHAALSPWETRAIWWSMLGKVVCAPFYSVKFRDGYIGDILTSLVRVWVPCAFSVLYVCISLYAWLWNDLKWAVTMSDKWWTGNDVFRLALIPFLTLYPLWVRLVQCLRRSVESGSRWPHLANALKYTSAIVVIAFATFRPALRSSGWWVLSLVGATLLQYSWDLTQDWGIVTVAFVPPRDGELPSLSFSMRAKRLLGPEWVYMAVMAFNLALRFAWTLTLLPLPAEDDTLSVYAFVVTHIGPIVAVAEIVRRMVWGFFRLEFEQIEILERQATADAQKMSLNVPVERQSKVEVVREEDDWARAFLPSGALTAIGSLRCASDKWASKLRLVESLLFASVVAALILLAARPVIWSQ